MLFSSEGIKLDPGKVKVLARSTTPKNKEELKGELHSNYIFLYFTLIGLE